MGTRTSRCRNWCWPAASCPVDISPVTEELVGGLHGHAAEVGDEVCAVRVACNVAFGATSRVLAAEGQHVATVATPVRTDVVDGLEPVRDAVVDLLGVVFLCIRGL